jgi:hypothetical protein
MTFPNEISADLDEDDIFYGAIPALYVPFKMLTNNRLGPLLLLVGSVGLETSANDETGELVARIAISNDFFETASDETLTNLASLFRGLKEASGYHPRLAQLLLRSLN